MEQQFFTIEVQVQPSRMERLRRRRELARLKAALAAACLVSLVLTILLISSSCSAEKEIEAESGWTVTVQLLAPEETAGQQAEAEEPQSRYGELMGCTLDANGTTYDAIYCRASTVHLQTVGMYNAIQGLEVYLAHAVVWSVRMETAESAYRPLQP